MPKRFGNNSACRYKIEFPSEADEFDLLVLNINKLTDAKIYAVEALRYSSEDFIEHTPI